MGKREVGQLGVIDLIVSILIAELVAISIENTNDSIFHTIIPICLLVSLEIIIAFISVKSSFFRRLFDGKTSLIVINGHINYHEMIKQRYTMDDLLLEMRQKEIKCIDEVEYAFLEPNGKLSIFKYNKNEKNTYPMPLILDGKIDNTTLAIIKKNKSWLIKKLEEKNIKCDNVFYAFFKNKCIYIIKKCELK